MRHFDEAKFISKHITKRSESLFSNDIEKNHDILSKEVGKKKILVIGGAGTIGSSFIKALLPFKPGSLVVVDYSENGLTELTRDLRSQYNDHIPENYITYPFDFGSNIFRKLFLANAFDVVACFAAHKHVRSEKDHLAIEAMITNNVINTYKLLELCRKKPPTHFFSVSTDKAANPVNVMGASKKMMENTLMAYGEYFKISTARFANVAFSNGSLLHGFNYRIAKRQPISAPSDVRRYFVSPQESGQLCLLACILGNTRDIFFPILGEDQMLTFSSLAESYLEEKGFTVEKCISEQEAREQSQSLLDDSKCYPVCFFKTDTSGEKMFEEFFIASDSVNHLRFETLGVINNPSTHSKNEIENLIKDLHALFENEALSKSDVINFLKSTMDNFNHIETGKNLDQRM